MHRFNILVEDKNERMKNSKADNVNSFKNITLKYLNKYLRTVL